MILDTRTLYLEKVRTLLSHALSPIKTISIFPKQFFEETTQLLRSKRALISENEAFSHRELLLREELQHIESIRKENKQLKSLLKLSRDTGRKTMAARVLSIDTSPVRHVMTLDKGARDHVMVGQPVLSEYGLIGQVIEVLKASSTVLLISDSLSVVPVKNNRTGELGLLSGNDDNQQLILLHLPKTSSVMVNDLLVTSGLGGRYPEGYPVGRVAQVLNKPGEHFIDVQVTPTALLTQTHLVLLIWSNAHESWMKHQLCHSPKRCLRGFQ